MKIEKLMSIESFLEICEQMRKRIGYDDDDKEALEKNISESVQKSQFEPVCNPWGFSYFGESPYGYYNSTHDYTNYHEFINSFYMWLYKGYVYAPRELKSGNHEKLADTLSKEQISLLILEHYDNERKQFERLKNLYSVSRDEQAGYKRPSIPEQIRIEVWRRDEGKCVQCGSKEKLEYDHIIPISKGGSNTARNIQLLCETCNRSKGAKIG